MGGVVTRAKSILTSMASRGPTLSDSQPNAFRRRRKPVPTGDGSVGLRSTILVEHHGAIAGDVEQRLEARRFAALSVHA